MLLKGKQAKVLLQKARDEHYAFGAFNVNDYFSVEAVLTAAEELGVPAILQTFDAFDPNAPEGSMMSESEAANFTRFTLSRAEASPIPVLIHLDHCNSYQGCIRGIQSGNRSVMLDNSMKPYEENVATTRKVVEAAHGCDVLVEAEIGHVSGHANSTGVVYTSVDDAVRFVSDTGIDLVAVSVGTCHGVYATEPQLNYERMTEIYNAVSVPLVLHGASGLSKEQYQDSIKAGISKVNFATYGQLAGGRGIVEAIKGQDKVRFGAAAGAGRKAMTEYFKEHMVIFGTKKA